MFRTEIQIKKSGLGTISHRNGVLFLGSCFADSVGRRFVDSGFAADINPFGTLYNPLSIEKSVDRLVSNKSFSYDELFFYQELWHSFAHHGSFSNANKDVCLQNINKRFVRSCDRLKCTDFVCITLGTAWVYRLKSNGEIVANCHKMAAQTFIRECLSLSEVEASLLRIVDMFTAINPKIKIVFTVSPIRHLRDGAHANQLSKALLLLAVEQVCQKTVNADYFPAYEIVLDDLRDYRFYTDDMVHITDMAVDYIWDKWSECFFEKETCALALQVKKLKKSLSHIPLHADSTSFKLFRESIRQQIEELKKTEGITIET